MSTLPPLSSNHGERTMKKFNLEDLIENLPAGLDRAILRVLSHHQGEDNGINVKEFLMDLARLGFNYVSYDGEGKPVYNDRPVRAQITLMRKNGFLIGAQPGKGYYLIQSREEYEDFRQAEYGSKIADMSETMRAMDREAEVRFGRAMQPSLF